jgi:DNA-binding MarR family transcriptional regulator
MSGCAPTEAGLEELPPSAIEVLRLVTMHPGCGILFITEQTKMRQGTASTTARSLVERGLVDKQVDPDDLRAVQLRRTRRARRDLEALRKVWNTGIQDARATSGITDDESAEFARVLTAIHRGLTATAEGAAPIAADAFDRPRR